MVLVAYVLWRVFGFQSEVYGVEVLGQSALTISTLLSNAAQSIWTASVAAWGNLFHLPPFAEMGTRLVYLYIAILLASLVGLAFFRARLQPKAETILPEPVHKPLMEWFVVGFVAVLVADIPFLAASLQVKLIFPSDRFTQPFALGTALILAAALELLPGLSWRALGTGALAALAIGIQIQNAFAFREDWQIPGSILLATGVARPGIETGHSDRF